MRLRLREIYGGPARVRSLTVAGISAAGGAVAGLVIGTTALTSGASQDTPPPVRQTPVHKQVRHHTPTPYVVITHASTTPSRSPSASPTPTTSAAGKPAARTSGPAAQPTQTATPAPTTAPPSAPSATSSPVAGGPPASPGAG